MITGIQNTLVGWRPKGRRVCHSRAHRVDGEKLKPILQLVARHNYKFSHELEMGMMNAIFKVSYQNAILATKLSFKTNQHVGRKKKKKDKKHLSSLYCNAKHRTISCAFSVVSVSVCGILGMSVHCLYWQMDDVSGKRGVGIWLWMCHRY